VRQTIRGSALFFAVGLLSLIAALLPLVRGGRVNVVFLCAAVIFAVLGVAIKRRPVDQASASPQ
jgi:hypothetical protein